MNQEKLIEVQPPPEPTYWDMLVEVYEPLGLVSAITISLLILAFFGLSLFEKETEKHLLYARLMLFTLGIHWSLGLSLISIDIFDFFNSASHGSAFQPHLVTYVICSASYKIYLTSVVSIVAFLFLGILAFKRAKYLKTHQVDADNPCKPPRNSKNHLDD